jgi:tetratricopeptide (TPR) repeat protein
LALEKKLPELLKGDVKPANLTEHLQFADLCRLTKRYAAATRFYAEVFDASPDLVRTPANGLRYQAAASAALAGCGKSDDADKPDDRERARLRRQSLDWLKADLALWEKLAAKPDLKAGAAARKHLQGWQDDANLSGVRDKDALAKFPKEERELWRQFWDDVEKLSHSPGEDAKAIHRLGRAAMTKGRVDEAIEHFRKALELDPKFVSAHADLGDALFHQGRLDEAVAAYRRAIQLDPTDANTHTLLGIALLFKGQPGDAIEAHRQAIAIDPKYGKAHGALGMALQTKGQFADAREAFRRCLDLTPKTDPFHARTAGYLRECEQIMALEQKLPEFLKGDAQPATVNERLLLADLCARHKKLYVAAARFLAEALDADAALARDPDKGHRYAAACCAAMAGCGKGEDAGKLDDKERARLRQQSLDWLKADLALWDKVAANPDPKAREAARQQLEDWQQDADLAGVRDQESLAKLPDAERDAWTKLWDDVAAVLKKASEGK